MKKLMLGTTMLFGIVAIMMSCEKEKISERTPVKTEKDVLENQHKSLDYDLKDVLKEKYGVQSLTESNGNYTMKYEDGKEIFVYLRNDTYFMTGSKINGRIFMIDIDTKQQEITAGNITITDVTTDPDVLALAPCGSHPPGQTFGQCFAQEWRDFCTDFASCAAQIAQPYLVATAIVIHCAACT